MGSSSRKTLASRDMARAICAFSRMPLLICFSFMFSARPKNLIMSLALSARKSGKKSENILMHCETVAESFR